jgi:hypothetical protein
MNYFSTDKDAVEAAEAEIFSAWREQYRATDPDAMDDETGTVIGRNAATGELMPNATRTTGYFGTPQPAIQGFFHPVPEDESLQLANPATTGVDVTEHLNPWPSLRINAEGEQEAPPLPEWVQPTGAQDAYPLGMWVQHQGADYESLLAANVWEPSPESNFWRISPDPGPLPWRQPAGAADAYAIGDRVTHTVAGRETDLWESNIDANTTEPGTDGTPGQWFDRWWAPIDKPVGEINEWAQPVPGVESARPYEVDALATFEGETYRNTVVLNVWPPSGPGAFGWVVEGAPAAFTATGGEAAATPKKSRMQELASLRRRDAGKFVGDDPSTPGVNEAWK